MKKKLLFAQIFLTILFLFISFSRINFTVLSEIISNVGMKSMIIFLIIVLMIIGNYVIVLRWKSFINISDKNGITNLYLFKVMMITRFLGNFLPGLFTSDLYRVYALNKKIENVSDAAISVLFDRFIGQLLLLSIPAIVIPFVHDVLPTKAVMMVYGLFYIFAFTLIGLLINVKLKIIEKLLFKLRLLNRSIFNYLVFLRRNCFNMKLMLRILILSLIYQLLVLSCFFLAFYIFSPNISIISILVITPLINIFLILPLSINGIGQREAIFISLAALFCIPQEIALSASITIFISTILHSLIGGIFLLFLRIKRLIYH